MWSSVYRRDLADFFYSRSAYFIFWGYALLSLIAALFWGLYLLSPNRSMLGFFVFQPQILVLIIPAITMRSWAEERRNGTIENLLTFPISDWVLITAKYMASVTVGLVMLLFCLPLLLTTAFYLGVDWLNWLGSLLAVVMVILELTALGCLTSSVVSLSSAAYLLGLIGGVLLINFNFGAFLFANWPEAPFYLKGAFSFSNNYQSFVYGRFSFYGVFYFLSLSVWLLLLNWLVVSKTRKLK